MQVISLCECLSVILVTVLFVEVSRCQSYNYFPRTFRRNRQEFINPYFKNLYDTRILPTGQLKVVAALDSVRQNDAQNTETSQEDAKDKLYIYNRDRQRRLNWFKKELMKCGNLLRYNAKFIQKSDDNGDDFDTIRIKIPNEMPYGYQGEYFPSSIKRESTNDADEKNLEENGKNNDINNDERRFTSTARHVQTSQQPLKGIFIKRIRPHGFRKYPPLRLLPVPYFHRPITPRPWVYPTPWRLARPGTYHLPYPLREPFPGFPVGMPPPTVLRKKVTQKKNLIKNIIEQEPTHLIEENTTTNPPAFTEHYQPFFIHEAFIPNVKVSVNDIKTNENIEKITPTYIWDTEPIYDLGGSRNNFSNPYEKGNIDRFQHVRNLNELSVNSKTEWVPVMYPGGTDEDELRQMNLATNYVTTSPSESQQIYPSTEDLAKEHYTITNNQYEDSTTKIPDLITSAFRSDDTNHMVDNIYHDNSTPMLITKENMNRFNLNNTVVFFNVVDNKNSKSGKENDQVTKSAYSDIPHNNSSGRQSRFEHISTLVSSSMLVKDH